MNTTDTQQDRVSVPQFKNGQWRLISDSVTRETAFRVFWEHRTTSAPASFGSAVLWSWPKETAPLALGHVLLDRVPAALCLHREASVRQEKPGTYHVSIGPALPGSPPAPPESWRPDALFAAMHSFLSAEGMWDGTGCFHRAGVFDPAQERLLCRSEDIGRHNCVDRIAGWSILQGVPLSDKVLLISARMTSSLCAKALRAGFRILVSRSAITGAAVSMAREAGATLVGFARTQERRFTLFADPLERLKAPAYARDETHP